MPGVWACGGGEEGEDTEGGEVGALHLIGSDDTAASYRSPYGYSYPCLRVYPSFLFFLAQPPGPLPQPPRHAFVSYSQSLHRSSVTVMSRTQEG